MADFQLPEDLLDKICNYFSGDFKNEPCGLICVIKGKLKFIEIDNISTEPDTFIPEPIKYSAYYPFVVMLAHGHSDNSIPSEHDKIQSSIHNIPYLIVNQKTKEYSIYTPAKYYNLLGRSYNFGVSDCFELARDWYKLHGIYTNPRKVWQDDWWDQGLDYIGNEINEWPFIPTFNLEYGNLLVFKMGADVPNHIGIYLEDDLFIHHAVNRLSCVENLYPIWGENIVGIYKHEKGNITRLSSGRIW